MAVSIVLGVCSRAAAAQIREVRGLLGIRYDRLSQGDGRPEDEVLGQARFEVLGFVLRPDFATFSINGESRRGVVTAPASSGLFRIGTPTTVQQAGVRLDLAPRSRLSGSADYSVSRLLSTAARLGSVQHSFGVRGVLQGGTRLPVVTIGYRRGRSDQRGGLVSRASYSQATVDISKSGERSYVAAGLRSDWAPQTGLGLGLRTTTANLVGSNELSQTLRFSAAGSYADRRALFSSQSGSLTATLGYQAPDGTVGTFSAAADFSGFMNIRARSQHLRLDASHPVRRGVSAGGAVAFRQQAGAKAGAPELTQSGVSASGSLVSHFTLGGQLASVTVQGGYGRQSERGSSVERRPSEAMLLGASGSMPTLALGWLAATSGFQVEHQRPVGGGAGSLAYSISELIALTAPGLRWTTTAVYSRFEAPSVLTTREQVGQALPSPVGQSTRATLQSDLDWRASRRFSMTAAVRVDRQFRPAGGSARTATGRITTRASRNADIVVEGLFFQYSGGLGADFANLGIIVTQRYRLLELHSEVRHVRPFGGNIPTRTYVTAYASRAFSMRPR